jgi:hypothetical protein
MAGKLPEPQKGYPMTLDSARLGDPEVAERRERVVRAMVDLFREVAAFVERPVGAAWDDIRRLEREAAIDIDRMEARVERLAIEVIAGTATFDDLERTMRDYLLFWRRAFAALELRLMTCSECGDINTNVAARSGTDGRTCRRCWKAATWRPQ